MKPVSRVTLFCAVHSLQEQDVERICQFLKSIDPDLGFSPAREAESLIDCLEFRGAGACTPAQKEELLARCNDDWDEEDGLYWAYGFNTTMFDEQVYYLQLDFS